MKYTYFSTIRSGKYLMRNLFWLNKKSTCALARSKALWASLTEPMGKNYKWEWYWIDKKNNIQTCHHTLDISNRILSARYYEKWFPTKNHLGYNCLPIENWGVHENFWSCIDTILRRDIITNPFTLLGYFGRDPHRMINEMKSSRTTLTPHPDIIQQLRKRKNIIAYKEDIEHLAYNIFSVLAAEKTAIKRINQIRQFQEYMPKFLDKHKIPYELFSLDSGDYAKTFELEKTLPRDCTQSIWHGDSNNIDTKKAVSNYMRENP